MPSQRKTSRHWSLTRIERNPFRSPLSASADCPAASEGRVPAADPLSMSSLTSASPTTSCRNRRARLVGRLWHRSSVARSPNQTMIDLLGHERSIHAITDTVQARDVSRAGPFRGGVRKGPAPHPPVEALAFDFGKLNRS